MPPVRRPPGVPFEAAVALPRDARPSAQYEASGWGALAVVAAGFCVWRHAYVFAAVVATFGLGLAYLRFVHLTLECIYATSTTLGTITRFGVRKEWPAYAIGNITFITTFVPPQMLGFHQRWAVVITTEGKRLGRLRLDDYPPTEIARLASVLRVDVRGDFSDVIGRTEFISRFPAARSSVGQKP